MGGAASRAAEILGGLNVSIAGAILWGVLHSTGIF